MRVCLVDGACAKQQSRRRDLLAREYAAKSTKAMKASGNSRWKRNKCSEHHVHEGRGVMKCSREYARYDGRDGF
eukprot:2066681-Pleurochrysis_carterae.AAC.1